ncbi:hypothetical protein GARCT_02585 [Geobacillus sp. 12AMOR1]|nr:hypothetical protein GARCT_02585 [Geobacillus sp. 12AMOR1]
MIENGMVLNVKWEEPRIIGECAGCHGEIVDGETIVEFLDGQMIHYDKYCAMAFCLEAGKEKTAGWDD